MLFRSSRLRGTQLIAEAARAMFHPPQVLISASAIGWYGDRGDEVLSEDSAAGTGFLSDVCRDWEGATEVAARAGIRVVQARLGIVLSRRGGALKKMLFPFQMGVGGKLGSGRQYMSWIALDDVVGAITHAINTASIKGPVNVVAPAAATNSEFTRALGKALPAAEDPIFDIPIDHAIFKTQFQVPEVPQIPNIGFYMRSGGGTSEQGADSAVPHVRGITDPAGRLIVLMTHNTDIADAWEREGDDPSYFYNFSPRGYAFGINTVLYALTH